MLLGPFFLRYLIGNKTENSDTLSKSIKRLVIELLANEITKLKVEVSTTEVFL